MSTFAYCLKHGKDTVAKTKQRRMLSDRTPSFDVYSLGYTGLALIGKLSINTSIAKRGLALLSRLDMVCVKRFINCRISTVFKLDA